MRKKSPTAITIHIEAIFSISKIIRKYISPITKIIYLWIPSPNIIPFFLTNDGDFQVKIIAREIFLIKKLKKRLINTIC